MKTRLRIILIILSISCLLIFFGGLFFVSEKAPVGWDDVVFNIRNDAGGDIFRVRLWHNYTNDKDYLFLPSFIDTDKEILVSIPGRYIKTWDNNAIYGDGSVSLDLSVGEHDLRMGYSQFRINIMCSVNIPTLVIDTESGSLSHIEEKKGNGEPGIYRMLDVKGDVYSKGELSKLRSRGNITFEEDKKPYQMNLKEPADLGGFGLKDKYILLANRQDASLIRNRIMYDLAVNAGVDYSPKSIFADLYINNDYRGVYQICGKVDTGRYGIDIDTQGGEVPTDYLVSLEYNMEERMEEVEYPFTTDNGQNVTVKRPDPPTKSQMEYIKGSFQQLENDIKNGDLQSEKMDIPGFARKYILEEYGKNLDAMHASQYFYEKDGRFYAGPVWDHDKTLGNPIIENTRPIDFQEPMGIYAATIQLDSSWWYDLCQIPKFMEEVRTQYRDNVLPAIEEMLDQGISSYEEEIRAAAAMEYERWDTLEDQKYGRDTDFDEEYDRQLDIIRDFMEERRDFLTDIWLNGKKYDVIECDPGEGRMSVRGVNAIEGSALKEPRDPELEGYKFTGWVKDGSSELYDFTEKYDGVPFKLTAVYEEINELRGR